MTWYSSLGIFTFAVVVLILWWEINVVGAMGDSSLRVVIPSGSEQCFYQDLVSSENVWIDYSVVGSQGSVDINFQLSDPHGRPLVSEFKKSMSSTLYGSLCIISISE